MRLKKWNIGKRCEDADFIGEYAKKIGVTELVAQLLYCRGFKNPDDAVSFINLENFRFHDPFLLNDMDKACRRIISAVDSGEKIVVYGDYDVDGITSTSILYMYLKSAGANVSYYIPSRSGDGYGVNRHAIDGFIGDGCALIITVDTGITAFEEVEYAREKGCDFVITDHHECRESLPGCVAVVNPKRVDSTYPFSELAGVGVAFKLICALELSSRKRSGVPTDGYIEYICRNYMDLVAIGTVADVMPLTDENRLIVSYGLHLTDRSRRVGINALLEAADKGLSKRRITVSTIAFTIAPRLNAAGRMDDAVRSVELFLTESPQEAEEIAQFLCLTNSQRRAEENDIIDEIDAMIADDSSLKDGNVIVLSSDRWHQGVIGIAASRVSERYSKPCILITFEGDIGKGSGRSVKGFNLVEALSACSDYLTKYGGHELAAGLGIERCRLNDFITAINSYAPDEISLRTPEVFADIEITPDEISLRAAEELEHFEPCGTGNPMPVLAMRNVEIAEIVPVGNGNHTRLLFSDGKRRISAIMFGTSVTDIGMRTGEQADIIFNLTVNEFQGRRSEQLVVKEIFPSRHTLAGAKSEYGRYAGIINGEIRPTKELIPDRSSFATLYRRLKNASEYGGGRISLRLLSFETGVPQYVRLRLTLDILSQAGLVTVTPCEDEVHGFETVNVKINDTGVKVNLEETCLFKQLKTNCSSQK